MILPITTKKITFPAIINNKALKKVTMTFILILIIIYRPFIQYLAVSKDFEGLGIGSKLVTYATNQAISIHNCKKVLLYCSAKTRPFYEKLGYKIAEDTVVMKFESLSE